MKHPRTTVAGILMLVQAVCMVANSFLASHPVDWVTVGGLATGGYGLIVAADGKKTQ